ncbi:DNA / pantothenate metabolism flavoprotein, partial [Ancylostoma duodenale]
LLQVVCDLPRIKEAVEQKALYKDRLLFVPFSTLESYFYYLAEPTHKIQSSGGELNLRLSLAPKAIDTIVNKLVPDAFVVSFKLETDESLLISKSRHALEKYGHELVIGNILQTRKVHVVLVDAHNTENIDLTQDQVKNGVEIEREIIAKLQQRHSAFISK